MKHTKALALLLLVLSVPAFALLSAPAGEPGDRKSPNVLVDVSAALINGMVQRSIDRSEPVKETILDTPVEGKSRTLATVRAELIPAANHAAVDVIFAGRVYARTASIRPAVLIHTISTTAVDVRRRIVIDAKGIRNLTGPCCAESASTLMDVTCRREPDVLAIRLGRQMYEKNAAEGDIESAHKTAGRVSSELGAELAPELASASKSVGRALQKFTKAGLTLESMHYQTTPAFLQTRLRFAVPGPIPMEPPFTDGVDLGLRVHQSLVNEVGKATLAGKSFPLDKIDSLYDDVTRGFLLDGRKGAEQQDGLKKLARTLGALGGKNTIISIAKDDPLIAAFTDRGVTVEIHISMIRDEATEHVGMRVKADYQIETTQQGIYLVRKGVIQYLPSAPLPGKKLEPQSETLLLLREVLFTEILKERFVVNLPVADAFPRIRFQAPGAETRNGWLALAWKLK